MTASSDTHPSSSAPRSAAAHYAPRPKPEAELWDRIDEPLSLGQLNEQIARLVEGHFDEAYWVTAELSEVRTAANGHCYIEFVEKNARSGVIAARARGMVWAGRWGMLREAFEQATGEAFRAGLKVLVRVRVTMHVVYGYSLEVLDIDPSYTMGEMARHRAEVIRRLTADGIIGMNKELPLPHLPQRIAVISAAGAAGYGDFCHQLAHNDGGFAFYPVLFAATMQGDKAEASIIEALERIFGHIDLFDAVVIIRGGGAVADLACFDSYALAAHCAQFPLPIIAGIGHERDTTVLDLVAHTSVKTPTAAAALLIGCMEEQASRLLALQNAITAVATGRVQTERTRLAAVATGLPQWIAACRMRSTLRMQRAVGGIRNARLLIARQMGRLDHLRERLAEAAPRVVATHRERLAWMERTLQAAAPENVLHRGFSITRVGGKAITDPAQIKSGDRVVTQVAAGSFTSVAE